MRTIGSSPDAHAVVKGVVASKSALTVTQFVHVGTVLNRYLNASGVAELYGNPEDIGPHDLLYRVVFVVV